MDRNESVLIIGGGLGGLFTGALLARNGIEVTIVEKNATVGGGLQSFRRRGHVFDTGMHIIGGMRDGGNVRRLCDYLGITDRVAILDTDDDNADEVRFGRPGEERVYTIPAGREAFAAALAERFPAEAAGIRSYVDEIFAIADRIDLFNLRPSQGYAPELTEPMTTSAVSLIARHVGDPELRALLAYLNPLYGGRADMTPAYVHALIHSLYIRGASRFVDGSQRFADLLASVVTESGGTVIKGDAVTEIAVDPASRRITGVVTASGRRLSADSYVSAVHPEVLFSILGQGGLSKAFVKRVSGLTNTYSAFSIYLGFKPETFPYLNRSIYTMSDPRDVWNFHDPALPWPSGYLFMTPPVEGQGKWAGTALITAPMAFDEVERWSATTVGRRSADYEAWKAAKAEALLEDARRRLPALEGAVDEVYTASPLTIRDYYGSARGCISGFSKDFNNPTSTIIPVVTKIPNLLLTGQCCNLHGFCGTPLTAVNTAEAILGPNAILSQL